MQQKTVLSLTVDLLANNAFGHLRDDKISALHHLIIKLQKPLVNNEQALPMVQESLLLNFWNFASTTTLSSCLLQQCNQQLQRLGRGPLELQAPEESYFD